MTTNTEALRAPQPAAQQGDARVTLPDDIERMAVNRYRPVPAGVLAYKVVGGDGDRSLFSGTKDECQIVARKLTEAFLDGAHVALAAKAETAAAVAKERERCIGIIESHHIPVGNSAAGEMACEWTYDALKTIRDAIRAGAKNDG